MHSFASRLADRRYRSAAHAGDEPPALGRTGLEVIGAGFGRTGTMSLKIALEQLGLGPCYHMTEIVKNPSHARLWRAADAGKPVDWAGLFNRYRACVDWPACHYYRELMDAFAGAKVILTLRDPQRWYDSVANTLYSLKTATDANMSARLDGVGSGRDQAAIYENRIWKETFSGKFEERRHAIEVFERHNAEVMKYVPAERLLVYQVRDGWRPLCGFLGVAPPDLPFPHVNSTQSFRDYNRAQLGMPHARRSAR